jgi:anaphase-promoting complex subunit 4
VRRLRLRSATLARMTVNGRVGRRTVCVVEGTGSEGEVLDMAEEEEGEEEEAAEVELS